MVTSKIDCYVKKSREYSQNDEVEIEVFNDSFMQSQFVVLFANYCRWGILSQVQKFIVPS